MPRLLYSVTIPLGDEVMNVLPRAEEAIIPLEKFVDYALDPKNSHGKFIAFRDALGYNLNNVDELILNIRKNINNYPVTDKGDKGYGNTYTVLMELTGANGKKANVMTAWIDDKNSGEIRLTSAYVKKRKDDKHD